MDRFGEAAERPPEHDKSFLLHRRKLNLGFMDLSWRNLGDVIRPWKYPLGHTRNGKFDLPRALTNEFSFILENDELKIVELSKRLETKKFLSLDLEFNDDYSYLGMTCFMQLGIQECDCVIDATFLHYSIMQNLKSVLEAPTIVKVVFGGCNDFLNLKRCFLIKINTVVDMQTVFDEILRSSCIQILIQALPNGKQWFNHYFKLEYDSLSAGEIQSAQIQRVASGTIRYDDFVHLFYADAEITKDHQLADFRIREEPSLTELLQYGTLDMHYLIRIFVFVSKNFPELQHCFDSAILRTNELLMKRYVPKSYKSSHDELQDTLKKFRKLGSISALTGEQQMLFHNIYAWRSLHAKLVDENPHFVVSSVDIAAAILGQVKSEDSLLKIAGNKSESLFTWKNTLLRLIMERNTFYNKMVLADCHNCGKIGH